MRSKPASPRSAKTGAESKRDGGGKDEDADGDRDGDRDRDRDDEAEHRDAGARAKPSGGDVEIELEVSRQRSVGWTIFGLIVGALLIWKLGTVGRWVGVVLMAIGAYRAWQLIQTFLYPAGTIVVTDREVSLPRGLCLPRPVQVAPSEVTAVYFLRRSVPWNRSAPVLVVELGERALAFPRDWFASEADQRHVVHALLRGVRPLGALGASASSERASEPPPARGAK